MATIKYVVEIESINDFDTWGDASDILEFLKENDLIDYVDDYLDGLDFEFESATVLNDWVWFDCLNMLIEGEICDEDMNML